MESKDKFLEAYETAITSVEKIVGVVPEDYKVLLFLDPSIYDSVLLQTTAAGSPKAVISSNELDILKHIKDENFTPSEIDLFYASRNPRIFFPKKQLRTKTDVRIMTAKLVHQFAKAVICENISSSFPDTLDTLYRQDAIIYNLFSNNVFELAKERSAPWVWQYFQDFTATIRLLGLYDLDDFYVPPTTIRSASVFYNYLLEIKEIIKERANTVKKGALIDLILNGFGELVLEEHLDSLSKIQRESTLVSLKSNLGQSLGVVGKLFLKEAGDKLPEIYEATIKMKSDFDLVNIWNRATTKANIEKARDNLSQEAILWHSSKSSYWSDLWPLRASQFDKTSNYVGKIQRRKYKNFSELLSDSPLVTSHGRVGLRDREVAVLSIQEDTVGQEQLLILRNHLQAMKDTFVTPLPGLPDVIVFKKFAGMHVASYLGVNDKQGQKRYPNSPYDLPLVVRAVQVTRKKGAYISEEREDIGKIDTANYDNLSKLTQPQHQAIKYLIRQGEVVQ